jgi:soluble lytic murein transglycosylase-like protein
MTAAPPHLSIRLPETSPFHQKFKEQPLILTPALSKLPPEFQDMFLAYSVQFDISADLLIALGKWESGLDPLKVGYNKKSNTYDNGMFQINSKYESEYVWRFWDRPEAFDHFNPEHSLYMACRILSANRKWLRSEEKAIRAYNVGVNGLVTKKEAADRYYAGVMKIRAELNQ